MSSSKLFIKLPEPSVWEDICSREKKQSPFAKKDEPEINDYDAAKTSPIFYGRLFGQVSRERERERETERERERERE